VPEKFQYPNVRLTTPDYTFTYEVTISRIGVARVETYRSLMSKQMQKDKSNVQNTECIHTECICL